MVIIRLFPEQSGTGEKTGCVGYITKFAMENPAVRDARPLNCHVMKILRRRLSS
jgi:hypothetical protein